MLPARHQPKHIAGRSRTGPTWAAIERLLSDVPRDLVWIPNSNSYIALGWEGKGVAWVGKTYVVRATGEFAELPGYEPGGGGGSPLDQRLGELCDVHFIIRSLTGECEYCD